MFLLALIPEIFDAITVYLAGGGWWQLPALVALFKVEQTLTTPLPQSPAQQSPVETAVGGAAAAVGGTGQAIGSLGQFIAGEGKWWAIGLGAIAIVLGRR